MIALKQICFAIPQEIAKRGYFLCLLTLMISFETLSMVQTAVFQSPKVSRAVNIENVVLLAKSYLKELGGNELVRGSDYKFESFLTGIEQTADLRLQAESWKVLGDYYRFGEIVEQNYEKALFCYKKAVIQDLPLLMQAEACIAIGDLFRVMNDETSALTWFKEAIARLIRLKKQAAELESAELMSAPLFRAVCNNDKINVAQLLDKGQSPDSKGDGGNTLLHIAVEKGFLEIVELLLGHDAQVNKQNNWGRTALHLAAEKGFADVVDCLLGAGADSSLQEKNGWTPLHFAAFQGDERIVETLLKCGSNVQLRAKTLTPVKRASEAQLVEKYWTPLHCAAYAGYANCVKVLIEANAPLDFADEDGMTPFLYAVSRGHKEVTDLLFACRINSKVRNTSGCSALHLAASKGHTALCEDLLLNGADISAVDLQGRTPLHGAIYGGNDVVILLLGNAANVRATDNEGNTPLHLAALKGSKYLLKVLLVNGALAGATNKEGRTPLHFAAKSALNSLEKIILLVAKDVDINATDNKGWTPLHFAARSGHQEAVAVLIARGANPEIADHCSQRASDYTTKNEILNLLRPQHLCYLCASVMNIADGNVVRLSENCRHTMHAACKEGLIYDKEFDGKCPTCRIPVSNIQDDTECSFCLEELIPAKCDAVLLGKNCLHFVHQHCRDMLIQSNRFNGTCLVCRAPL